MLTSLFTSCFDNEPILEEADFASIFKLISSPVKIAPNKTAAQVKRSLPAYSPAIYYPELTRGVKGVCSLSYIALDFDNSHKEIVSFEDGRPIIHEACCKLVARPEFLAQQLRDLGLSFGIHTSFSNGKHEDWPKFRVLIPFSHVVLVEHWEKTVDYVLNITGLSFWRESIDIKAVKDPARLYYFTAAYYGPVKTWYNEGSELVLDMAAVEKQQVINESPIFITKRAKKQREQWEMARTGQNVSKHGDNWWRDWEGEDLKTLDLVAYLEARGVDFEEPEKYRQGIKIKCTCPFHREHSNGDKGAAAVFLREGKWPAFKCLHSHNVTLKEVLMDQWRY